MLAVLDAHIGAGSTRTDTRAEDEPAASRAPVAQALTGFAQYASLFGALQARAVVFLPVLVLGDRGKSCNVQESPAIYDCESRSFDFEGSPETIYSWEFKSSSSE